MNGWWFDELGGPVHLVCGSDRVRETADGWACVACEERDEAVVTALPVLARFEVATVERCVTCGGDMPSDHRCSTEVGRA